MNMLLTRISELFRMPKKKPSSADVYHINDLRKRMQIVEGVIIEAMAKLNLEEVQIKELEDLIENFNRQIEISQLMGDQQLIEEVKLKRDASLRTLQKQQADYNLSRDKMLEMRAGLQAMYEEYLILTDTKVKSSLMNVG